MVTKQLVELVLPREKKTNYTKAKDPQQRVLNSTFTRMDM